MIRVSRFLLEESLDTWLPIEYLVMSLINSGQVYVPFGMRCYALAQSAVWLLQISPVFPLFIILIVYVWLTWKIIGHWSFKQIKLAGVHRISREKLIIYVKSCYISSLVWCIRGEWPHIVFPHWYNLSEMKMGIKKIVRKLGFVLNDSHNNWSSF